MVPADMVPPARVMAPVKVPPVWFEEAPGVNRNGPGYEAAPLEVVGATATDGGGKGQVAPDRMAAASVGERTGAGVTGSYRFPDTARRLPLPESLRVYEPASPGCTAQIPGGNRVVTAALGERAGAGVAHGFIASHREAAAVQRVSTAANGIGCQDQDAGHCVITAGLGEGAAAGVADVLIASHCKAAVAQGIGAAGAGILAQGKIIVHHIDEAFLDQGAGAVLADISIVIGDVAGHRMGGAVVSSDLKDCITARICSQRRFDTRPLPGQFCAGKLLEKVRPVRTTLPSGSTASP